MRKLKFRAYDKDRKEYLSGGQVLIGIQPGANPKDSIFYLDILKDPNFYDGRFVIQQYTGLNDCKGKEIYEGDVVDIIFDGNLYTYQIVFDKQELDFKATNGKENYGNNFQYLSCCDEVKVIGNIYDNPDLLEFKS